MSRGYDALLLVTKTIDKVMTGELELKDLTVSKILRQDLYKYRSLFPHVSAALQLTEAGVPLTRGDTIQYIYTDAMVLPDTSYGNDGIAGLTSNDGW